MTNIRALISDVDGTLIDTLEVIRRGQFEAATAHFQEIGMLAQDLPEYDVYNDALLKTIGGHVRETLESTSKLLYADHPDIFRLLDFDRMVTLLTGIQDEMAAEHVRTYDGLQDLLRYLGKENIALGIFTSGRPHHLVRNFGVALPELGMQDLYKDQEKDSYEKLDIFIDLLKKNFGLGEVKIITGDDVTARKPDPEPVYAVLDRLNIQKEHAVAFGDHSVDMMAASSAGVVHRIGITHGFDDEATLTAAGATKVIHQLDEVIKYLQNQA